MTEPAVPGPVQIVGHLEARQRFAAAFSGGQFAHAWLLCGLKGIGKATLARAMARYVLAQGAKQVEAAAAGPGLFGEDAPVTPPPVHAEDPLFVAEDDPVARRFDAGGHADFRLIDRPWADSKQSKRKTVIPVESIRALDGFFSMTTAEGGWRAVLIDAADEMNSNSANALLKMLEEPPPRTLLLLVAHAPERLLPTIRSRCRTLMLHPLAEAEVISLLARHAPDLGPQDATALARLAEGSIGRALSLSGQGGLGAFAAMLNLLRDLPRLPAADVQKFSDANGQPDAFSLTSELLIWWLGRAVTANARGAVAEMAEILPGEREICARIGATAPLDRWVEVWENMRHLFGRAEAVHLDRKRVLMNALFEISHTCRAA